MKSVYDEDSANEVIAEEKVYQKWERETKNAILSITNSRRKQLEWNKHFPRFESNEVW